MSNQEGLRTATIIEASPAVNQEVDSHLLLLENRVIPLLSPNQREELLQTYCRMARNAYLVQPRPTTPADIYIQAKIGQFLNSVGVAIIIESGVKTIHDAIKRQITINKDYKGWMLTLALVHETAHRLAGHNSKNNTLKNRADVEVVAEAVATIVMGVFGIDTACYSTPKIAGVIIQERSALTENKAEVIKCNAPQIRHIATQLLTVIGRGVE